MGRSTPVGQEQQQIWDRHDTIAINVGRALCALNTSPPGGQECQQIKDTHDAVPVDIADGLTFVGRPTLILTLRLARWSEPFISWSCGSS